MTVAGRTSVVNTAAIRKQRRHLHPHLHLHPHPHHRQQQQQQQQSDDLVLVVTAPSAGLCDSLRSSFIERFKNVFYPFGALTLLVS